MIFERSEMGAYLTLIFGVIVDNTTTKIGISRHDLVESNIIAKILMDFGVWSYVDLLLCILLIFSTYYTYHSILEKKYNFMIIFPFISGLFRLYIGLMNILIM